MVPLHNLVQEILTSRHMTHHFQPIWKAEDRTLLGFEALARFPDAPPDAVFRAAEESHLGVALDRLSVQEALRQGQALPGLLFVNLNPNHLGQSEGPFGSVGSAIAAFRRRRAVVMEITEQKVEERNQVAAGVGRMHRRDIKLALDDAGTGKSDAARLKWIRPRFVKIAGSVIQQWAAGKPEPLLRWIRLAGEVDAELIAEGIEDASLIAPLAQLGVHYLQGFALGKPQPAEFWLKTLKAMDRSQLESALSVFLPPEWSPSAPTGSPLLTVQEIGDIMYSLWPFPAFIVDRDNRLVGMNLRAERHFGTSLEHVALASAEEALGLASDEPGMTRVSVILPGDLGVGETLEQRVRVHRNDGQNVSARLMLVGIRIGNRPGLYKLATLISGSPDNALPALLGKDPVSGLPTRAWWESEQAAWRHVEGAVIFLDVDGLKQVNDLFGHLEGDRLLADMGRIIHGLTEEHSAVAVRYGGDEFLIAIKDTTESQADSLARKLAAEFSAVESSSSKVPATFSYGVAAFQKGGLQDAIRLADRRLYEHKGFLLTTPNGSKLVLTANGRRALWQPIEQRLAAGLYLDRLVQQTKAPAIRRAFVDFINPEPGLAVVEVNAGRGQVGFVGGLSERLGSEAQYLGADSNGQYLTRLYRQWQRYNPRARVHFLRTPADQLPIVSQSADLTLLGWALPSGEAEEVLREMARITRSAGQVALAMIRRAEYSDPIEKLWNHLGHPEPSLEEEELMALTQRHNLSLIRTGEADETLVFPTIKDVSVWLASLDVEAHQYLELTDSGRFNLDGPFEVTVHSGFWLFERGGD
ncbi:EAL domain-containing protein [Sulfobacillus harzensis]|uniref:EAL domain-containing protein n=1 Tax=Sulfobacillus harzensis TaxID=2729629 RepID=A0A7Y0Q2W3_9FIRM|nr:EAL domain-containing protein [Sulfobacillus harzensis]NMP22967.1 EAL domain-containing protein [Sulfobacillus harzensis]